MSHETTPPPGRIEAALVEVVGERGYLKTSLEAVLERAGVDRAAFDRSYADLDECFAETWERIAGEVMERALLAFSDAASWVDGIRALNLEFCRFLEEDHGRARFFWVELSFAGERLLVSRDRFMNDFVGIVDLGRFEGGEAEVSRARAEGIVGGGWDRVAALVRSGSFDELHEVMSQLLYLAVLPYAGADAAREVLCRADGISRRT